MNLNRVTVFTIFLIMIYFNEHLTVQSVKIKSNSVSNGKVKRALTFPRGAICGLQAAIAIPLDLAVLDVFVANNFEANYGLPTMATDFTQGPAVVS